MSTSEQRLRTGNGSPPREVVERARHVVAGPGGNAGLLADEALKAWVHRLHFQTDAGPVSVVAKRLDARVARANELLARRWLPAVGLERARPGLNGIIHERSGAKVWHIYEDIAGSALDGGRDPARVGAVVELIADIHSQLAGHPLLPQCREGGEELGIAFFDEHVRQSIDALRRVAREQAELRDRLLHRMERLSRERDSRATLLDACGGPDTLLHGDLWLTNTLVGLRAGEIEATLIDWDHVGVGPVTYDLSTFLYRFAPADRPWILAQYREAAAGRGWDLPEDSTLNLLFETAECARYACCLGVAGLAALEGEAWGFERLAEVETWFAGLQPALAVPDC